MNVTNFLKTPVGLWVRKATKSLYVSRRKWIVGAAAIVMSTSVMATEVYTGTKNNIPMVGNAAGSGILPLDTGTWAITAKVTAKNNNGVTNTVKCSLTGASLDTSRATLTSSVKYQTLSFITHSINNTPGNVGLVCRNTDSNGITNNAANTTILDMRITATRIFDPNFLHINDL